jgi:hypothetical protein
VLLYDNAISGNCYKVRLLFSLLGIEYERREVSVIDRSNRAELLGELTRGSAVQPRAEHRRAALLRAREDQP